MACTCEKKSQSLHASPGLVEDREFLIRIVFKPEMIDAEGNLKNSAIPSSDLERQVEGEPPYRGYSVFREGHSTAEQLQIAAKILASRKTDRESAWSFRCLTKDVRALLADDGFRSLCVVDRATCDNTAHAEMWGGRPGRSKAALKNIRDQLVTLLTPVAQIM